MTELGWLSQEKILKIMNMVKNKEVSIEGALHLAQKEVYAEKDPQDLLTGSQFNFIIYKYKHYRWQKRILQLDFNTRTIFNIEKGTIKKQFPFSQVKGCEDSERRRFSLIIYLLSRVIQSNSYKTPVESWPGRAAECDVIHEGLLDLQQNTLTSTEWVKLRVPLSVQNSMPEAAGRLQREWVSLLERHCQPGSAAPLPLQGSQGCSSPEADYEEFVVPPDEQEEEGPHLGGRCARSSLSKPPALLAAPAAALPPATGRAEVPPAPPALPQPCSLPPAAKRTKAFHWDVVPCDKMCKIPQLGRRLDLLLSVRELPESIRDLEPLITQNIQASKQLQSSPKFAAVLEYILAMGNHLNEKAGREVAKGFRLSSLAKAAALALCCSIHCASNEAQHQNAACPDIKIPWHEELSELQALVRHQLSLLRGRDRTFTLLHALVEQILLHQPELATFPQELTEFEALPDASMKGLSAEVDVLKKELENLIQCRRLLKPKASKATPQESQFCKELKVNQPQAPCGLE
ncbi:hypothetical protein RLOC_00006962 [Lonchura striata]|uniref:FH2 domain-containing protein n=1 Tax=Lonchura striata TaxID=40157 RepID=A0A218ULM2_9PASE|nr:hypothetical protein RLOC_00006962 [Lonchura striata domestica]